MPAMPGTSSRPKNVARRWYQLEGIALVRATIVPVVVVVDVFVCSLGIARRREPGRRKGTFYCELINPTGEGEG